jgi:hypothetical protein
MHETPLSRTTTLLEDPVISPASFVPVLQEKRPQEGFGKIVRSPRRKEARGKFWRLCNYTLS